MEAHKCKLCSRGFTNGRALGGHMKAHLTAAAAALPLPPPKPPATQSSSSSSDLQFPPKEKATLYELRENPKKNFRFSDPVFDIVLQDRESETESQNPSRKRSRRYRKLPESGSSVSDTSPEEDLAMCLMMLSRDRWIENGNQNQNQNEKLERISLGTKIKVKKGIRRKKKCEKCRKQFRSYRALFSHEKICELETEQEILENGGNRRVFKCPFCLKLFGSGQALGGHKRSHLLSSTNAAVTVNASVSLKLQISLIDLNLPAPLEQDDYSVVSDA